MWAFQTIQNILDEELDTIWSKDHFERRQMILQAVQIAKDFGFLTPMTDIHLKSDSLDDTDTDTETHTDTSIIVTYNKSLGPVKPAETDHPDVKRQLEIQRVCTHPIQCKGNFLFEPYEDSDPTKNWDFDNFDLQSGKPDCVGRITVFTKSRMRGDNLQVEDSLCQLYHAEFDQKIMSVKSEGSCCWVLFEDNFFVGETYRVCGDSNRELSFGTNVRSILKAEMDN